MRASALTSAIAAALAIAGPAAAACNIDEAGLSERHAALAAERGVLTDEARQAFHGLRATAETLDRTGFQAICGEVVDAALRLLERETAWTAEAAPSGDPEQTVGALNLVTFAAIGRPVETASLVGRPVYSTGGAPLGTVGGVLLDQSRDASHVVLSHGGFWEKGERLVAIPSTRMLLDPSSGRLFTEIPAAKLGEAPEYDRGEPWRPATNDAWYDERAAEAVAAAAAEARERRAAEIAAADNARAEVAAQESTPDAVVEAPAVEGGPKRVRVEKDRPEAAMGSND